MKGKKLDKGWMQGCKFHRPSPISIEATVRLPVRNNLVVLNRTFPLVPLARNTSDRFNLLFFEVLVGLLLPFPAHGLWWWTSQWSDEQEDSGRNTNTNHCIQENLLGFSGRGECTRTMGAEGNPVRYARKDWSVIIINVRDRPCVSKLINCKALCILMHLMSCEPQ